MTGLAALPHPDRALRVVLDDDVYTWHQPDTRVWLDAGAHQPEWSWWPVLSAGFAEDGWTHVFRRMMDPADALDLDDVEDAALSVLSTMVGIGWVPAWRLLHWCRCQWRHMDAWGMQYGFDPLRVAPHRLINLVYAMRMDSCENDGTRMQLHSEIFAPPEWRRLSGRSWDQQSTEELDALESASFMPLVKGS